MTWHPRDLPDNLRPADMGGPAPLRDDPWQHDPDRATRRGY